MGMEGKEEGRMTTLTDIARPVRHHLDAFPATFRSALRSSVGIVELVTRYLVRRKGKQIRPLLVLLSADACGGVNERSFRGAGLVEILHTATLVHDDVVDEADTRRGFPSINARFKNKIAVLMGDYLLSRGLLLSLDNGDVDFLAITSRAVKRMSEGELQQIVRSRKLDLDEPSYYRIIGDKTASLLSTCCEIGAASTTGDPAVRNAMADYGEYLGMAFQIRDDLLDYIGRRSVTGKPTGLDLSERKLTLPLIHALARASARERKEVLAGIRAGGKKLDVKKVLAFVETYGGLAYADAQAREFAGKARAALTVLPPSPARDSLDALAEFVVQREK
jgi:octaprenyl-diphosphate synthase